MPDDVIQFGKKLVSLENLGEQGVRLLFKDGTEATADLVVGADGIQSVCSSSGFDWRVLLLTRVVVDYSASPFSGSPTSLHRQVTTKQKKIDGQINA